MPSWRRSRTVAVAKYSQWPLRVRSRKRLNGVSFVLLNLPEPLPGAVVELVVVLEERR